MKRLSLLALLASCLLPSLLNGCGSDIDTVKKSFWANDKTVTYGTAFSAAFGNGSWSEVQAGKEEKLVQFTGTITPGLHEYAVGKLNTSETRIVFSLACNYLAKLIKTGEAASDKGITFNIRDYPINKSGMILYDIMGDYTESKDNAGKIETLINFYRQRYWETGSTVLFYFRVTARGKVIRVMKASNPHWDRDMMYENKPENILKMVFDYTKNKSR